MAGQSSPSSSYGFDYDVFLSFRGSDTRSGFTGHLYNALDVKGIRTFIDDRELRRGEEITSALSKYIEESKIAIIVFSENYASSSFCLDELVHIIECSKAKDRLVLPVFYDVEPSHLRHLTGSYGEAIAKHEEGFQDNKETYNHNMERMQKWKLALNRAADLAGYDFSHEKEYEYEFIGKIVDEVSNKINYTPLHVEDYRVGLESRVLQVKSLLDVGSDDGVYMVGIHGIGGIGKTTLAREIYNSIANQFKVLCFLDDVKQKTRQHGLVHLQETLLYETIRKDIKLGNVNKGISIIKQRLHTKKVLLILDDVDDLKQLEAMVGDPRWLGPGSRVIITTRDKQLLANHRIERTYEVEELNKDEALELLRWKAFKNNKVESNYEDILNSAVTYASGLPLALEVVGSNLCGKHTREWESALARYKRIPHKEIQKILEVSFKALEEEDVQSVFLDIACCFNRYKLEEAERILCAHHGHCIKYHIGVLVEKSLIKLVNNGILVRLQLHDLIEDMGKEIVRRESPNEPGERSRLWFREDIVQVLKENTGTSKIEIIHLDLWLTKAVVDWNGKAIKKMRKLKTLIIKSDSVSHFSEGPKYFPSSLRVLEWQNYPLQCIPSIFSNKKFENMKVLKFFSCEYLTHVPDVSSVPNLEIFSFKDCYNLTTIHKSVGFLNKLKILDVSGCRKLRSFPPIKLTSLRVLKLRTSGLESFPEILGEMKNVTELDLLNTSIKELPFSFHNLTGLSKLDIRGLRLPINILMMSKLSRIYAELCLFLPIQNDNLSSIPSSNVKVLDLVKCNLSDENLPIVLKLFANVVSLTLQEDNFTILPECIKECRFLGKLRFFYCNCLQEIRGIPPKLKYLDAECCKSLSSTSRSMLLNQELHEDGGTFFCLPGTERIPEWFEHQSRGPSISFWFRNNIPSVALFFVNKKRVVEARLFINGDEYNLFGEGVVRYYNIDQTYLFDLKLQEQDRGLESKLDEALLKNEWIHAEVRYDIDPWGDPYDGAVESGIHVFKEKTNMEDIHFPNPYKQRFIREQQMGSLSYM